MTNRPWYKPHRLAVAPFISGLAVGILFLHCMGAYGTFWLFVGWMLVFLNLRSLHTSSKLIEKLEMDADANADKILGGFASLFDDHDLVELQPQPEKDDEEEDQITV